MLLRAESSEVESLPALIRPPPIGSSAIGSLVLSIHVALANRGTSYGFDAFVSRSSWPLHMETAFEYAVWSQLFADSVLSGRLVRLPWAFVRFLEVRGQISLCVVQSRVHGQAVRGAGVD